MLKTEYTTHFKKDFKMCKKRNLDINLLKIIIDKLSRGKNLEEKYKDHVLMGDYKGHRECHIQSDWLLVYYIENSIITFVRTGTHSDLF